MQEEEFTAFIWERGRELFRPMPWRENTDPYYVLVSEIMLQQTQVDRVIPKFQAFIVAFPTVQALAAASLEDVLAAWSGLGYNRRAKFLHQAATVIEAQFGGSIPSDPVLLKTLPGVGVNTAGAIATYSFNKVVPFVETNVRTVYFNHFFKDEVEVNDKEILNLLIATIDAEHPREWYWALMDYGSLLKRSGVSFIDKSKHYKKQSPLKGSVREVRGEIVKKLIKGTLPLAELEAMYRGDDRLASALEGLIKDEMITETDGLIHLTGAKRYNRE